MQFVLKVVPPDGVDTTNNGDTIEVRKNFAIVYYKDEESLPDDEMVEVIAAEVGVDSIIFLPKDMKLEVMDIVHEPEKIGDIGLLN